MDKHKKKKHKNGMRAKNKANHQYAVAICLMLPLLLVKYNFFYLSIQAIFLLILTLRTASVHSVMLWKNQTILKRPKNTTDWVVVGILIVQFCRILFKMIDRSQIGAIQFETELVILLLGIQYWIISMGIIYKDIYLDLFLYVGLIIIAGYLIETIAEINLGIRTWTVFEQGGTLVTFLILFCSIAIIRFCACEDRYKRISYGALSFLGVFAFFLERSLVGILSLGLVFLFMLMKGSKHIKVVKRIMLSAFCYFFLLSNMPLIIEVFGFEKMKEFYQLEYSVYLDLAIAIAGVTLMKYWEKNYENNEEAEIIVSEAESVAKGLLYLTGIAIIGSLLLGMQKEEIAKPEEMKLLHVFINRLTVELKQYPSAILQGITKQGWLGLVMVLGLLANLLRKVWKHGNENQLPCELWILSMLGIILGFVLPVSIYVTPVCWLILCFTLFGRNDNSKKRYQELRKQNEKKII